MRGAPGDPVPRAEVVAEVTGSTTGVPADMTTPDSAVVTVLAADGTVLAEEERDLDRARVGGSAACGGPMAAAVEAAAP
ncbi:hypothetical protein ACWKWC_14555 [Geodermatophilus nigrescens]